MTAYRRSDGNRVTTYSSNVTHLKMHPGTRNIARGSSGRADKPVGSVERAGPSQGKNDSLGEQSGSAGHRSGWRARQLGGDLIGHIPGEHALESEFHPRFRDIHVPQEGDGGTEHFAKTSELLAFIDEELGRASAVPIPRTRSERSGRA
jgi:hypothetical protein